MKRIILLLITAIVVYGCGVGTYTVSSGKEDVASLSFTATATTPLVVVVDDTEYSVNAVKQKAYKADRKIKATAYNTITITPGKHNVRVLSNGQEVYNKTLFISTSEHRIIDL